MNSIDLTPLYRNSIGFDRLATLLDNSLRSESTSTAYPPYNIEMLEENRYAISLAVAGFEESDLDIQVERNVLTVTGKKSEDKTRKYLHQGISHAGFERRFNLADYVDVTGAEIKNGLLTISLKKEIPEEMKPRTIQIHSQNPNNAIEHKEDLNVDLQDQHAA